MRQTFSVAFFLRKKNKVENKQHPIVARITVNGQCVELSTHLKCSIKYWKANIQQAKGRSSGPLILNSLLHDIRARINYIFHQQTLQVDRGYLTMDELKSIIYKEIEIQRLDLIRDIFVFASFTGLAYGDLKNLQRTHLYNFNGDLWLKINRCKTGQPSTVKLFDIPKRLIRKYDIPSSIYIFPVPSNQKVNAYLKEIADICGITKNLTFHLARPSVLSFSLKTRELQEEIL